MGPTSQEEKGSTEAENRTLREQLANHGGLDGFAPDQLLIGELASRREGRVGLFEVGGFAARIGLGLQLAESGIDIRSQPSHAGQGLGGLVQRAKRRGDSAELAAVDQLLHLVQSFTD